jgi:hypothetical protein
VDALQEADHGKPTEGGFWTNAKVKNDGE